MRPGVCRGFSNRLLARAGWFAVCCGLPLLLSCSLRIIEPDRFPEAVRLHDVTPYLQEPQQCGPYALAAVQNFMGIEADAGEMSRRLYSPGAGGTLTMDLYLEAARSGLPARQKGGSTPELRKQLESGPVIVLFRYPALLGSGGHFIVVTGYSSLMDSQRVYQAGGAQDAHPGVGATPAAWDGFTPLPRQARDGELVEPLEGDHAFGVTASQDGSKRPVARLSSSRSGFFLLWGDGRLSWMDEKRFEGMWSGSEMWMLTIDRVAKSRGGTSRD